MADAANHIFLAWVQPSVAASIPEQSVDTLTAGQPAVVSLPIRVAVNADAVDKTARLYGPGDVTAIDPQQVVRLEPRPHTTDFEPNYFPAIEFDRPDFPWLFTPARAGAQGRLRPWLCLIVVRKQPGVELRPPGTLPVPVLHIEPPASTADELPDLAESHFWAHAQATGAMRSQLATTLAADPSRSVSRLLCARRLEPTTEYIACVVPTFDVGRKAGLDVPVTASDEQKLEPAWGSGQDAPPELSLPVYYSWEFRTGAGGDFEELVRRLEPRQLPPEAGKRPMDIRRPGFAMEPRPPRDAPGGVLGLEGALRVVNTEPDPWPDVWRAPFQTALTRLLNVPWQNATRDNAGADPIVGPPVYGCWHAAVHQVSAAPPEGAPPAFWLDELNLDPRHRAVAAMGTAVIQRQQEQLMASAWAQLGEIEKINQRLRQAQLSRAVNVKYHERTFARMPPETFVQVVALAKARVALSQPGASTGSGPVTMLMAQSLATTLVPPAAVSVPLRRLARPRGAVNRPFTRASAMTAATAAAGATATFAARAAMTFAAAETPTFMAAERPTAVAADTVVAGGTGIRVFPTRIEPVQLTPAGAVTIDQISNTLPSAGGLVWVEIPVGHWERARAVDIQMHHQFRPGNLSGAAIGAATPPPGITREFLDAASLHQQQLAGLFTTTAAAAFRFPLNALALKTAVLSSLNPASTVSQAIASSMTVARPGPGTGDELEPVMDAPAFPQPMYAALRDLSQDLLFPGLEHVPPNTVQLLQTNAKFIEAFLVGLNAEMGRELLWRDYPTDQRGTYFRQFWDTTAAGAPSQPDITPIHEWGRRALGTTAIGVGGDKLVLLIRGELLRRYPNTIIYAVEAVETDAKREPSGDPSREVYPIFRGSLEPDVTFLGFDLTPDQLMTGTGWYFVLQEQPTEPRFGLDDDPFGEGESGKIPELRTWSDLNWAHVAPSVKTMRALSHVPVRALQLTPTRPTKGRWGHNAAHMAYITRQRLLRIAIHATELLPSVS